MTTIINRVIPLIILYSLIFILTGCAQLNSAMDKVEELQKGHRFGYYLYLEELDGSLSHLSASELKKYDRNDVKACLGIEDMMKLYKRSRGKTD